MLEALAAKPGAKWFVVDGAPIVHIDSTGADTIAALAHELEARGVRPAVANLRWPARAMLKRAGSIPEQGASSIFEILNSAIRAFQAGQSETERAASNVEDQKARQSFMAGPHEVGDDCLSPKASGHMFRLQVQALRPLESARMTGT